jgi:hypothetical protein
VRATRKIFCKSRYFRRAATLDGAQTSGIAGNFGGNAPLQG